MSIFVRIFFCPTRSKDSDSPLSPAATLTVKETLRLSADCQMPRGVSSQAKADRVEAIMQLLGLKHRANTIVGDALLRGVSGGEKKRVSVGIEWAKSPGVWLFDEPTTGLDSSASYDVRPPCLFPFFLLLFLL